MTALRQWKFFDPIYMAAITIYRGPAEAFEREIGRRFGKQDEPERPPACAKAIEFTRSNGTRQYVLWVPQRFDPMLPDGMNTLAHEVFHLTLFVLMTRGLDATKANHEAYCYFNGWLFEQCWRRLRRSRRSRR